VTRLTELLHPHGFRTIGCYGGSEAVARARELAPDAIILDIMMRRSTDTTSCVS